THCASWARRMASPARSSHSRAATTGRWPPTSSRRRCRGSPARSGRPVCRRSHCPAPVADPVRRVSRCPPASTDRWAVRAFRIMDGMTDGPLIVQSDKTVLLEVDHELAGAARAAIAPFAELERAPEHVHTYRVTPLALWNARAAGHDAEQV